MVTGCSTILNNVQPGQPVEENLTRFTYALNRIFLQTDEYVRDNAPVYFIISDNNSAEQRFVDNAFQEHLKTNNSKVLLASGEFIKNFRASGDAGSIVSMDVRSMKVEYGLNETTEKSPGKKLSRNITVQVFCRVVNRQNGEVVFAKTLQEDLLDEVSERDIETIQNTDLSFARSEPPDLSTKSTMREILEMTMVLSTAGLIIYLLFSTRS